jgi:hypothetical protein
LHTLGYKEKPMEHSMCIDNYYLTTYVPLDITTSEASPTYNMLYIKKI